MKKFFLLVANIFYFSTISVGFSTYLEDDEQTYNQRCQQADEYIINYKNQNPNIQERYINNDLGIIYTAAKTKNTSERRKFAAMIWCTNSEWAYMQRSIEEPLRSYFYWKSMFNKAGEGDFFVYL